MISIDQFVKITKEVGIATIWIDVKGEKMNIISPNLISVFDTVFEELINDVSTKAIILTSAKKDFIAGADIKSFKAEKKGDFIQVLMKGHESLNRIANSPKPIIAAISGTCYGLGTELSLACHARIISDEGNSKMALPEVKLGLLPGAGGTQRLPRLVGITNALDMMLTGKNVFPYSAKKIGLVDEIVPKSKLIAAALILANRMIEGKFKRTVPRTIADKFLNHTILGNAIVYHQAKKTVYKSTQGNYPAPNLIIECVKYGMKEGISKGLKFEAEKFESLMLGEVSKELIDLFFIMTENKKNPYPSERVKVSNIGIIGGGFMGEGIAQVSIDADFTVMIKDLNETVLENAKKAIWQGLSQKINKKIITQIAAEKKIGNLRSTIDNKDLKNSELIIEAIVENLQVKQKIIQEIESIDNTKRIIASNTSSLSILDLQSKSKYPENIIGMHYFSPVSKMPLLEIVTTEKTSKAAIATAYEVGMAQGKTCIIVKDGPGFYVNRILAPYLNECLLMLEEDIKLEIIENVFQKLGFPVGPFKLMDEVGLDIIVHATNANIEYSSKRIGYKPNSILEQMFKAGYSGKKNLKGFYNYDSKSNKRLSLNSEIGSFIKNQTTKNAELQDIKDRALYLMLQEASLCLNEGIIANKQDGNLAAIFGIGFMPFMGGPFRMIETMGENNFKNRLKELSSKYGVRFNQL